jgi:hypothetical protein
MRNFYLAAAIAFCSLWFGSIVQAQSVEIMTVEHLKDYSIIIPAQCSPEDLIIVINSSIKNLKFESNLLPDDEFTVIYMEDANQYIVCHEKIRFKLTVSGPNLQSYDIDVFDLNMIHAYRITSNVLRGTILVNTNPGNAIVFFPTLNIPAVSGKHITNNSGRYRINILKDGYKTIDTLVLIPSLDTAVYSFNLDPVFSQIKIDITTEDNAKFENAPIMWIDDKRISLDALLRPERLKRFFDGVEMFNLYEGNIIPLPAGNHKIRIESDNYISFETFIYTEDGRTSSLPVLLELVYGFITFIDDENALESKVFINDQPVGEVPIFKARARVGNNTVRFEKTGFMTEEPHYTVYVAENTNTDYRVSMKVSRRISIISEPPAAEIWLNGSRIGFTPHTTSMPAGKHLIQIKRSNYATERIELDINIRYKEEDTIVFQLHGNAPLELASEAAGLNLFLTGLGDLKNIELAGNYKTPAELRIPYGKYQVRTQRGETVTYRGTYLHHNKKARQVLPSYSKTSFATLTADYVSLDNIEASFGRIHIFPGSGLSTSIINAHYFVFTENEVEYKTLMPNIFFLNWDWRMGGSIFRHFDVCMLGRVKYTPGLKMVQVNLADFEDATMLNYFYGVEVSTRFSYINFNCRFGQQVFDGDINTWDSGAEAYSNPIPVSLKSGIVSFGFTWNGRLAGSNNMLRLWNKPMANRAVDLIQQSEFKPRELFKKKSDKSKTE